VKLKKSLIFSGSLIIFYLLGGCAKMGMMSGGTKDTTPPAVVSSKPKNYSNNFNSQKIEIVFSEFIQLKNVNQELIISPPLPKKPTVRVKNKTLMIELNNELREKTTYTLNFGKAVADNNEGNPLTNFEFVFSTGEFLDSLSVQGILVSAFNLRPSKEPFIVGIYDQMEDSIPLKSIPVYIGKTDDKGHFMINNIKEDTFKVFALKDLNNNLKFDLPTEEIAYSDTLLLLTIDFLKSLPERVIEKDTLNADTIIVIPVKTESKSKRKGKKENISEIPLDTVQIVLTDSVNQIKKLPSLFIDLVSFLPEGSKQYMTNSERVNKESFKISFSLPLKDDPGIRSLSVSDTVKWFLPEINASRDTFIYWLTDTSLIKNDTLMFELSYPMLDSAGAVFTLLDTLKFVSRAPSALTSKSGKNKTEVKIPEVKLTISSIKNKGILDLNTNIPFTFNFPIQKIDTSFLHLYLMVDTVEVQQKYTILKDSVNFRKAEMTSKWKEKGKYKMMILPGAFTDIYNHGNDTIKLAFSVQEKAFYGNLMVSLSDIDTPMLVQLVTENEGVIKAKSAISDGTVIFDYLPPAKYKLKFIYDVNQNKKWDTGDYFKKRQPEKVLYYVGEINIRSNWDLEVKQSFKEK